MKLKRRAEPDVGVDMTPMIDCVFLLLIFFMVSASMSQIDFTPEVKLPVAPKSAIPEDLRNRGAINILPMGTPVSTGGAISEKQPFLVYGHLMSEADLKKTIASKLSEDPDMRVYMRIDRDAEFKTVKRGIKSCAEAGAFDIIFATFQSKSGG